MIMVRPVAAEWVGQKKRASKKVLAILPVRGGSKGIPKKNIILFDDEPLMCWSIRCAQASKYIDKIVVSSDSEEILDVARNAGACTIKRPEGISGDTATTEDTIRHVLWHYCDYDIVVLLQVTSPLREPKDIDSAIEKLVNSGYNSVFSACEAKDAFLWDAQTVKSITYDYQNRKRRQDINGKVLENGSIYAFEAKGFLEYNNRLFGRIGYSVMENYKQFEIDDQDDLKICEFLFKDRGLRWKTKKE